eukprot:gene3814-4074_t
MFLLSPSQVGQIALLKSLLNAYLKLDTGKNIWEKLCWTMVPSNLPLQKSARTASNRSNFYLVQPFQ